MNKKELVTKAACKAEKSDKVTNEVLNALLATITESLEEGESVQLMGFGTFKVKNRAARMGKNPKNGELMEIPAKKVPHFAASRDLKARVDR